MVDVMRSRGKPSSRCHSSSQASMRSASLPARSKSQVPRSTFSSEMMIGKALEIAFEAGPGAALQAAIVLSNHSSPAAEVSVGISCISTRFTTAMMEFDVRKASEAKERAPEFNGFSADEARKRVLVLVELFAVHTAH